MSDGRDGRTSIDYFPPSPPIAGARAGFEAQSKRGGFGESWWAKRWIEVLESFDLGARLQRGRRYARNGPGARDRRREGQGHGEGAGLAA